VLAVSATVIDPGQWLNNACSAGQDAVENEVTDCTSATVVAIVPTLTPTPTVTGSPTLEATATATLTASPVPTGTSTPAATSTPQSGPTPTT